MSILDFPSSKSPTLKTSSINLIPSPLPSSLSYKAYLDQQISEKSQKRLIEKAEHLKPGIHEDFYGYPNLPQTPQEIRRKRELLQMQQLRKDLNDQLAHKHQSSHNLKYKELESARASNELDYKIYLDQKNLSVVRKKNEMETLVSAWEQAKKAKDIKNVLEFGEKHKSLNDLSKFDASREDRKMEDEAVQVNFFDKGIEESPIVRVGQKSLNRLDVKEKAKKLKEMIDQKEKNSYRFKIKELVKDAKKQREIIKNRKSVSPKFGRNLQIAGKLFPKFY